MHGDDKKSIEKRVPELGTEDIFQSMLVTACTVCTVEAAKLLLMLL
jgi:hypothetical protein